MINFKILDAPNGNPITGISNWNGPVNSIQLKDGRSAVECAKYFCKTPKKLPIEIENILVNVWGTNGNYDLIGIPELKVGFDNFRGGKRNHDFYISTLDNEVTIGIEAKVDEPFGQTLEKKKYESLKSKGPERTSNLCRDIFGDGDVGKFSDVNYQLLSATAGTLVNAKEKACLVILTFKSTASTNEKEVKSNEKKVKRNKDALSLFKQKLAPYTVAGLTDCYVLPGYNNTMLFIREVEIQI